MEEEIPINLSFNLKHENSWPHKRRYFITSKYGILNYDLFFYYFSNVQLKIVGNLKILESVIVYLNYKVIIINNNRKISRTCNSLMSRELRF